MAQISCALLDADIAGTFTYCGFYTGELVNIRFNEINSKQAQFANLISMNRDLCVILLAIYVRVWDRGFTLP